MKRIVPPLANGDAVARMKLYVRVISASFFVCFGLVFFFNTDFESRLAASAMIFYSLTCLVLAARDELLFARITIPITCFAIFTTLISLGFGLHSVTVPALFLVIVFAALLTSRLASILCLIASMFALAGVLWAEREGLIHNGLVEPSTIVDLLNLYLILITLTVTLAALVRHMEIDRDQAQEAEHKTRMLNKELHEQSEILHQQRSALRDSERQYRLLAENVHDFIWTADLELRYTFSSPSIERMLGYRPDEIIGLLAPEMVAAESISALLEAFAEEIDLENRESDPARHRTFVLQLKRKDGSLLWVETSISFLRDDEGQAIGLVGTTRDISDRRRAEGEKAEIAEQLRQVQKVDSIGQLTGGIAHDFNNMLQGIITYAHLAADEKTGDADRAAHLGEVIEVSHRAAQLTKQLLAFSRQQHLNRRKLDLNEAVEKSMDMLQRVIREDIELSFDKEAVRAVVEADESQLSQILINLSVNARDAIPAGGKIRIRTENVELDDAYCEAHPWARPGQYVKLSFSDTGSGMDAETRNRVFEPFFTTKPPGEGTGLGLATVYGIVKQHEGLIMVYSEPGVGTEFKIYLPMSGGEVENPTDIAPESPPSGNETILLAEDEEVILESTQMILEAAGYRILPCANGREAVACAKTHVGDISLAILDVIMPEMGGVEAQEAISVLDTKMKFLFSSGYSADAFTKSSSKSRDVDIIEKPYDPSELLRRVREILDA